MFEPHETLDCAAAVGRGNTVAAIGDCKQDAVALSCRRDKDLSGRPVQRRTAGCAIFDRVVDQIGERLTDELPIAVNRRKLARQAHR